jgi:hypothetical protein
MDRQRNSRYSRKIDDSVLDGFRGEKHVIALSNCRTTLSKATFDAQSFHVDVWNLKLDFIGGEILSEKVFR